MQEVGRLFCGKCGNAALQKVEVVVGPNGSEQYGVRKKHILRGTRFPLPKPKVGLAQAPPDIPCSMRPFSHTCTGVVGSLFGVAWTLCLGGGYPTILAESWLLCHVQG